MRRFEEICLRVTREPFFILAYIGQDTDRAERVRSVVADLGGLARFYQVGTPTELAGLGRDALHVGKLAGCLLVVWDIDGQSARQALGLLDQFPAATGQVAGFVLAEGEQRLSLKDFLTLVDRNFVALGDFANCLASIQLWCGGTAADVGALDLTLPFVKEPSRWLRGLKHEYIVNTVMTQRTHFEAPNLWGMQLDIDFIGVTLRNLLCATESRIAVRGLSAEGGKEGAFYNEVYSTPVRIVAPLRLAGPLAAEYKEGIDFVVYDSMEAAADLLAAATREGFARIFFRAPDTELPEMEMTTVGPRGLPTILVAEAALELTWHEWQARLADNVVGSYALAELESKRSGQRVVVAQRSCWRACSSLSLPALFDRLIKFLEQTYDAVGVDTPALRQKVFLSLAAIDAARKMYLGETPALNLL